MSDGLKIIFAGTPEFAVPALQALIDSKHQVIAVYTQPDRPAGRGKKLLSSPIKKIAENTLISILQPKSLRNEEEHCRVSSLAADVMVVAAYGLILPSTVISAPRLGCINIHASLLPRWRGAAPIHRAILAGDTETGITIMQMDEGLDTGDMLYKVSCPIHPSDTSQTLHDRLAPMGAEALLHVLDQLDNGNIARQTQDDAQATYAHKLEKREADIDWQQPAVVIERMVRAFNPWPCAQSQLHDTVIKIHQAHVSSATHSLPPGTVVQANQQGIDVACGEGVLCIQQLQLPGAKKISAADFINAKSEWLTNNNAPAQFKSSLPSA